MLIVTQMREKSRNARRKEVAAVTMQDIAKHLGLSTMTVSRALRGTGRVSAETVTKVKDTAETLGYRPNPLVQTLMSNVRKGKATKDVNLAWITTHSRTSQNISVSRIENGSRDRAHALGYNLDRIELRDLGPDSKAASRILYARGIRGAIIGPLKQSMKIKHLPWDQLAVVGIGRSLTEPPLHHTMIHTYHSMERCLEELQTRGYQKIAYLSRSDMETRVDHASTYIFDSYCLKHGLCPLSAKQHVETWKLDDYATWSEKCKPDAIITSLGSMIRPLLDANLPIGPNGIGFASLSIAKHQEDLSGFLLPFEALGASAVDMVVTQLHCNDFGIPQRPRSIMHEADWNEGKTLRKFTRQNTTSSARK